MFTGIITDIGIIRHIDEGDNERRFVVGTSYECDTIDLGASIAHDGCCLTVVEKGVDAQGHHFAVDVSPHTLAHTTLGNWQVGQRINLERALRAGDELGGHIVSGHVDGVATISEIRKEGDSVHYTIDAPEACAPFIADKGSVTLDGTSLTVTWVRDHQFGLTLIPHTLQVTTWGDKKTGSALNLEVDMLARYVKRMIAYK